MIQTLCRPAARQGGTFSLFTLHSSFFTWLPLRGSCPRRGLRGRAPQCRYFFVGPCGPGQRFSTNLPPPGPPRPRTPDDFLAGQKVIKEPPKEEAFRFASPFGIPLPTGQGRGPAGPRLGSSPQRRRTAARWSPPSVTAAPRQLPRQRRGSQG